MDMGSSLGYGQSMEYHSISMPQPTQSLPPVQTYQDRLRQLREERMRRRQQPRTPTSSQPRTLRDRLHLPANKAEFLAEIKQSPLLGKPAIPAVPPVPPAGLGVQRQSSPPPAQFSPAQFSPAIATPANEGMAPAADAAMNTGMIQRVKIQRAAFLITGAFVGSSILGLVRTFLFTYVFGASNFSDSFNNAYLIPNLLFTIVAGGALSSAFIPVFIKHAEGLNDEKTAWHIASSALNISVVLIICLSVLAMIFTPLLVPLYTLRAEVPLTITLTRIMLFQAIVLGSGVIVSAVLNAKQDFTRTAIGTILYNVGQILGLIPGFIIASHSRNATPSDLAIYSATWGVVLAAILQVGVQIPGLRKVKMQYTFSFDWRNAGVIQIGRQMLPRVVNAAMLTFSTAVDRFLLSYLSAIASAQIISGLTSEYIYAFSILVLPVSIFGSSVSTAAFPALANYVARDRLDRVRSIIMETLREILFLSIPSCVGLLILTLPVIQVLLEHGHFMLQQAQLTVYPLFFFSVGLPGLAAVEILTRAFYALNDSKTPVIISVAQFIFKIALSIILINLAVFGVQWGLGMLAFSTSIASILEAITLFILLYQRIGGFDIRGLTNFIGRCLGAAAVMGVALFIVRTILDLIIHTTSTNRLSVGGVFLALFKLLIELGVGSVVFLRLAQYLNIEERNSGMVRRILNRLHITWL